MRILVVTPGFYGPDGDIRIPALVRTFEALSAKHELQVYAVSPEFGARPDWVQPWRLNLATSEVDAAWFLWPQRTAQAALATRLAQPRLPLVVSVMGAEGTNTLGRDRRRVQNLFRVANRITVGSGWLSERLKRAWPQHDHKFVVAPLIHPTISAPKIENSSDVLRLIAVSSLQPVKQPDLLLRVAQALNKIRPTHLDVFGWSEPDAESAWLKRRAELGLDDVVSHHGFVSRAELVEVLAQADVLLHPSEHEAQGMALIEAAALGIRTVCRDVGVAGQLKAEGAPLQWVQSDDPTRWVQAILRIHEQSSLIPAEPFLSAAPWLRLLDTLCR